MYPIGLALSRGSPNVIIVQKLLYLYFITVYTDIQRKYLVIW